MGIFPLTHHANQGRGKGVGKEILLTQSGYMERERERESYLYISALLLPFSSVWKLRDHFLSEIENNSIFRMVIRDGVTLEQRKIIFKYKKTGF